MTAEEIIRALALEPHIEGGYYRRSYCSEYTSTDGHATLSSIYYLLTTESPVGHWHLNKSDILHYFHKGNPIEYYLIHPNGEWQTCVLGPALQQGQQLQLLVPGGVWKASRLLMSDDSNYNYGLISEAVTPAFRYEDMTLGDAETLQALFPQHWPAIRALLK